MRKRFTKQSTLELTKDETPESTDVHCYTVSEITDYLIQKLKNDNLLANIMVKGEISNYKTYPSGHSYFTLKDKDSQIKSVMFYGYKQNLKFEPKNGMKVIITGEIGIYKDYGSYQLYAHRITEDGLGELYTAYEQLKEKLLKEGLFDDSHKKEIVKYPKRIGVVTASTGAAIRDIITTIKRRYPYCQVLVFSTLVQGDLAAEQIAGQIANAQNYDLDTLIVGRGGGSIEDLWSFNEEIVARAIYESDVPVISAVGHEVDCTISDYVADLRAPTPTAAAEMAVPSAVELESKIRQLNRRITNYIKSRVMEDRTRLDKISGKNVFKNPQSVYDVPKMNLDLLIGRFERVSKDIVYDNRNKLSKLENSYIFKHPEGITKNKKERYIKNISKLEVLNPLLTLKRGYAIAKSNEKVVSSSNDVEVGDKLDIEFDDGVVNTKVI
ncbi:MAG: exodeoxyribonuclease VII large subunit [Methanosphaera sp.]|nr:exodeoxyribonuclease VII large subunit [Methanosphaera sp.]